MNKQEKYALHRIYYILTGCKHKQPHIKMDKGGFYQGVNLLEHEAQKIL
jgi:hypothetical protein